jgi:hypothetical protein
MSKLDDRLNELLDWLAEDFVELEDEEVKAMSGTGYLTTILKALSGLTII